MIKDILNTELRKELSAKWNGQDRPLKVYPFYLVYQTESGGPFLLGIDDIEMVNSLELTFQLKGIDFARVEGEYPYEIYKIWKDKDKKK